MGDFKIPKTEGRISSLQIQPNMDFFHSLWAIADWVLRGFTINIRNPPKDWHAPWSRPMKTPLVAGDPAHMCIFLIDPRKKASLGLYDHQSSRAEKCTNRSTHLRPPCSWNSWKRANKNNWRFEAIQGWSIKGAIMIHGEVRLIILGYARNRPDTSWCAEQILLPKKLKAV